MEQVTDINGATIAENDIVEIVGPKLCSLVGYTFKVTGVSADSDLISLRSHGLTHAPGSPRVRIPAALVRRLDAEPALMHRDGLVAFG